jgi:hypothetical protein
MGSLAGLRERRAHELRLTPDRTLQTLDEAEEFLHDRGLLTRTADSALPSLYEAFHEDPYKPGARGFGEWPATKWPWFGELADRDGVYALKIHRGKHVLLTEEVARLADPILRAELERLRAVEPDCGLLLDHLAAAGPSELEDLRVELGLRPKDLKDIRYPLERCGAVVSRSLAVSASRGGAHAHTSQLARWDQVFPVPSDGGGLEELVVAAVRAAVVAPERELPRWFSWRWLWRKTLVDELVEDGRLWRPEPGWISAAETASAHAPGAPGR